MRKRVQILIAAASLFTVSLTSVGSKVTTKPWGATVDWDQTISGFEALVGQSVSYQGVFVHWGNDKSFPVKTARFLKNTNKTLVIFWEAMDYNRQPLEQPEFSYDEINQGRWDTYIREFALEAKAYGGPVILVPFSEMNGVWTPTGAGIQGNTPAKHVAAYRRLHTIFTEPDVAADNVKFGWSINARPTNTIDSYYPGDDVVDYTGVDGFNWDKPWHTFGQIFNEPLKQLAKYNKPIFIFSFASSEGPAKAGWLADAMEKINANPQIVGWIWFDLKKERNWLINSDRESLQTFKKAVAR